VIGGGRLTIITGVLGFRVTEEKQWGETSSVSRLEQRRAALKYNVLVCHRPFHGVDMEFTF